MTKLLDSSTEARLKEFAEQRAGEVEDISPSELIDLVMAGANWMREHLDQDGVLTLPDIRNKLTPITHLIWCAEHERGEKFLEESFPIAKRCVNYLAQNEVYKKDELE